MAKATLKQTLSDAVDNVRTHWNKPQKGEYISYKEILSYSLGGFGKELVGNLMGCFGLAVTNTFLAFAVGIRPTDLVLMSTVLTVLNIFFPFIRAKIIDNTRTKWGRFRPYFGITGFLVVGLGVVLAFLPYDGMQYFQKIAAIGGLATAQSFLLAFYNDTYGELRTVMSPNGAERARLFSVSSILWSFAPTITGLMLPLLSDSFPGTYANISFYRTVYVPIAIVGVLFSLFTAFGTKERIVVSKSYTPKVNVMHGVMQIYKNKYWWIKNLSGWISFSKAFMGTVFMWLFMFQVESMTTYGLLVTVTGTAGLIAMITTPMLIKKLGSVRLVILQLSLQIVLTALMWLSMGNIWLFFIANYVNTLVGNFTIVLDPVLTSNLKDYQQYKTGKRMDFTFGAAGVIGTPITMLTAFLYPYICEYFGFTGNANIFYSGEMRSQFFNILFLLSVIGAVVSLIPFFFYDLDDKKHREMVGVLKLRALYEDLEHGSLTDWEIKETVEQVRRSSALALEEEPDLKPYKNEISARLKKFDIKGMRAAYKEFEAARAKKEDIVGAKILVAEMVKFDTPYYTAATRLAQRLTAKPFAELTHADAAFLDEARALPEGTAEEKRIKRHELSLGKQVVKMAAKINKNYPNGLAEYDMTVFNEAMAMPSDTKEQEKSRTAILKAEEKKLNKYNNTVRPYVEAKELLAQRVSFGRYGEVEAMYDAAVIAVQKEDEADKAAREKEKAEKKADTERIKKERQKKKAKK